VSFFARVRVDPNLNCYNPIMVHRVDAIFSQGALRPVEPLALPEGTRVHLSVEVIVKSETPRSAVRIYSPRLANPQDAKRFVMEVRENGDAGL
jgi:predicted DNA-binding antitoxin AbrB/MazE fold protein